VHICFRSYKKQVDYIPTKKLIIKRYIFLRIVISRRELESWVQDEEQKIKGSRSMG
jgi:hypothetical protein